MNSKQEVNGQAGGRNIPLQDQFEATGTKISASGDLVDNGDKIGNEISSLVGKDCRYCCWAHFGVPIVKFNKTCVFVLSSNGGHCVFDNATDR